MIIHSHRKGYETLSNNMRILWHMNFFNASVYKSIQIYVFVLFVCTRNCENTIFITIKQFNTVRKSSFANVGQYSLKINRSISSFQARVYFFQLLLKVPVLELLHFIELGMQKYNRQSSFYISITIFLPIITKLFSRSFR